MVCGVECPGCAAVGGRLVLAVRCWFPVAGLAIALAKAEVSGGTDGVVCDDEFDVLSKSCSRGQSVGNVGRGWSRVNRLRTLVRA